MRDKKQGDGLEEFSNEFNPTPPTISPASRSALTLAPFRPRIHHKALWRGGAGAGFGGETQDPRFRVRGKWSPLATWGQGGGLWAAQNLAGPDSAPGAPVWRGMVVRPGYRGCAGVRRFKSEPGPPEKSPTRAGAAERPKSRSKNRRTGRLRVSSDFFDLRGSRRRPVRSGSTWAKEMTAEPEGIRPGRGFRMGKRPASRRSTP